jgi:hypothetical protein
MNPKEDEWLDAHALRLVPSLSAAGFKMLPCESRRLFAIRKWGSHGPPHMFSASYDTVTFWCRRGFVSAARVEHNQQIEWLYGITRDQPLTNFGIDLSPFPDVSYPNGKKGATIVSLELPTEIRDRISGHDAIWCAEREGFIPICTEEDAPYHVFFEQPSGPDAYTRATMALSTAIRRAAEAAPQRAAPPSPPTSPRSGTLRPSGSLWENCVQLPHAPREPGAAPPKPTTSL